MFVIFQEGGGGLDPPMSILGVPLVVKGRKLKYVHLTFHILMDFPIHINTI